MTNVLRKIKLLIFTYDWEIVEIEGAMFKICWGIWLLLPFQAFRTISGYNSVGTENYWGTGLLIYGSLHLLAILSGHRQARRWLTFGAFLFWLFTIFLIWQQSHTASLLPMFAVIAFFMGLNFIRIGVEIKTHQRVIDLGRPGGLPDRRTDV